MCLTELKKKEGDKRKAAEEKERRKLEREEKRKVRKIGRKNEATRVKEGGH